MKDKPADTTEIGGCLRQRRRNKKSTRVLRQHYVRDGCSCDFSFNLICPKHMHTQSHNHYRRHPGAHFSQTAYFMSRVKFEEVEHELHKASWKICP